MDGFSKPVHDTVIRNALVFDGSGGPPCQQDVAIRDGRIVDIGQQLGAGREEVDAAGQWLLPGLLDIHTHFDLEVELAPGLPEAVRHGTTTAIMSNCSLGLAYGNQRRDGADPIVDCFARVENVPKHTLAKVAEAVHWRDSASYLQHFDDLALGPNVAAMIPHSMLRIEVMGLRDSISRDPTEDELQRMEALLEKGMQEGYIGFSTDGLPFHYLANQPNVRKQIPTQFAPYAELKRLTAIVRRWGRVWQATPPKDNTFAVFRNFLLTSGRLFGRPLKVTAVAAIDLATNRSIVRLGLLLSRLLNLRLLKGQFRLQALPARFKIWSDGVITPIAEEIPELRRLNECDLEDRVSRRRILDDPDYVRAFRAMWYHGRRGWSVARLKHWLRLDDNVLSRDLSDMTIDESPVAEWQGESMQQVRNALLRWQERGEGARSSAEAEAFRSFPPQPDAADFFLHLLRRFDTDLRWWTVSANRDLAMVEKLAFHPRLLPGFNDSGAHLTNMAFYDGNLRMLKMAQRKGLARVSHAVHRLTREPAEFFGIDAGCLDVGARADLVLIDPHALSRWEPEATVEYVWRDAFAHRQLVNRPVGVVRRVFINGHCAFVDGHYTPDHGKVRMGRLLRSHDHEQRAVSRAAACAA
ncbi:amidohydrolase family protein [Algiphilus sp.]|uniref:N-acyl-D-amino-acid deacylase family protein n=1 Tax=Algiphilus sp. TaxID=1872431 RepID=UPI0032EF7E23